MKESRTNFASSLLSCGAICPAPFIVTNTNPSLLSEDKVLEIKNDILNFKEDE